MITYKCAFFLIIIFLISCNEQPGLPRPRAYPRVEYPEKTYVEYDTAACPFSFQYPAYAEVKPKKEACWFDLYIPALKANIHCSYLPVENRENFEDLVNDAFLIAERINGRANYMEESRVKNEYGVDGLILEWSGPAASPMHFFLTDSTQHFFKGALYFNAEIRPDSLAPITGFLKKDIQHLISTFQWEDAK